MTRILTGLAIGVALVLTPALAQDEERAAKALVESHHLAEARAIYKRLAQDDPENSDYQLQIGRLAAWMKDYAAAVETFDRVLAREPQNAEALTGKAYVMMWQQHYREAAELLVRAVKLEPEDPEVHIALARMSHYQSQERTAARHIARALSLDPGNQEAKDLRGELDPPMPVELHIGFTQDLFSFASPGSLGSVSAGYNGERNHFALQYEEWSRFDERVRRTGFNYTTKTNSGWWLRAGALVGPGAVVIPRQEYTAGVSHSLPHKFSWDADYRFLRFRAADVHLVSPALSYYFARPVWVTATLYSSWTSWRDGIQPLNVHQSGALQYYQRVANPVTLHAGYARGNENFVGLSIDRLEIFSANTYMGGAEFRLNRAYSLELFGAYQIRSNGWHQTTFGANLTVRQ